MALQLQMSWQPSLLSQKRKNGPPLGLRNLGNTCFLNSVLQCLTYTPPLANFCLRNQHSSFCDSAASDAERKRDCPFCILERRIVRSLSVDLTQDAPLKIQNCLRIFAEHFRLGRQEDAHEFLRYVIDACHNTCLRLKKLRRNAGTTASGGASTTVVKEIFGGALQSQVKCLSCGNDSNKVDEIMDISLDVLHSNSLKEALHKFFQPEVLDGTNKYKCDNCKKLIVARKQMSILQAPNVLVIQLKRFEGIFGGKIDKPIPFEEVLLLTSFMSKTSQDPQPEYKLFGTIVHSGFSPESGHYYAYIKDAMGRWYCCNDSYVSVSTLQEVLSEKVYILFFSRSNQRPMPVSTAFVSNGKKSHDCNCNEASKIPKTALPPKPLQTKSLKVQSSGKDVTDLRRTDKGSPTVRMKFNIVGNSSERRATESINAKVAVDKSHCVASNGSVRKSPWIEKIAVGGLVLENGNGVNNCKKENAVDEVRSRMSVVKDGNDNAGRVDADSIKSNLGNGTRSKETEADPDGHELNDGVNSDSETRGSKRKLLENSCILFRQDSQSISKVEREKKVLNRRAASILRSCGWCDEVYSFMKSRKRSCEGGSQGESKGLLIADARPKFISQIPESLKEELIQRLRKFSKT